jgi:hypothetical protein
LGYFANRDEAGAAAAELNRHRLPRAALLLKDSEGHLETWDPFSRRRLVGASLSIVIWGGLLGLAAIVLDCHLPYLRSLFSVPVISLWASMAALVVARLWFRRGRFGVERRLLRAHARRLVADESLLILQCPVDRPQATAIWQETGEVPPVLFFIPERPAPGVTLQRRCSTPRLRDPRPTPGDRSPPRPHPPRSARLCAASTPPAGGSTRSAFDLAAATRLDQGPSPVAEWILDNEYIIERTPATSGSTCRAATTRSYLLSPTAFPLPLASTAWRPS